MNKPTPGMVPPEFQLPEPDGPPFRVIVDGDPRLRQPSLPYDGEFGTSLGAFTARMLETMYAYHGIGLSAVQIGVHARICVIDTYAGDEKRRQPRAFINPTFVGLGRRTVRQREGCLSVPGRWGDVERPINIYATWLDVEGQQHKDELGGTLAQVLQHEIDHMDGILFIDKLR